jgi:hypothetical protein
MYAGGRPTASLSRPGADAGSTARGERSPDALGYFDAVVRPLYGYALMLPGLVRHRAPVLVEKFLASLDRTTTAHDERGELRPGLRSWAWRRRRHSGCGEQPGDSREVLPARTGRPAAAQAVLSRSHR